MVDDALWRDAVLCGFAARATGASPPCLDAGQDNIPERARALPVYAIPARAEKRSEQQHCLYFAAPPCRVLSFLQHVCLKCLVYLGLLAFGAVLRFVCSATLHCLILHLGAGSILLALAPAPADIPALYVTAPCAVSLVSAATLFGFFYGYWFDNIA